MIICDIPECGREAAIEVEGAGFHLCDIHSQMVAGQAPMKRLHPDKAPVEKPELPSDTLGIAVEDSVRSGEAF